MKKQCFIYDTSLRFSRAIYGILTLLAFLVHSKWLVLVITLLILMGTSIKFNVVYQFHALILRKLLKEKSELIKKESGELTFSSAITAIFLLIAFLFLYFGKFIDFAWILILIVSLLLFLACFVGICIASLMYVFFKKIFKK